MLDRFRVPLSWPTLLKQTFNEAIADDVLNLAAQQAYYFFFALFPALLALISIASFFPVDDLIGEIVDNLARVAPQDALAIVREQLDKIRRSDTGSILTIAFAFTLWSSSSAVVSMTATLNAAYDITESRPWWKVRLTAIGLTVGLAVFIIASMALVIAGPAIAGKVAGALHLGPAFEWAWLILQWPTVLVLVITAFALVYYFAPDAEQDWVWITPGAVLGTTLWIAVSLAFRYYIATVQNYNETYGAIGGVMVLLLWFYLSGIALLVGAELNAEIEHASPYGKDPGERVPGERKKIGPAAAGAYRARRERAGADAPLLPEDVNCDLDRPQPGREALRPSDLLIGAAALLPIALRARTGRRTTDRGEAA